MAAPLLSASSLFASKDTGFPAHNMLSDMPSAAQPSMPPPAQSETAPPVQSETAPPERPLKRKRDDDDATPTLSAETPKDASVEKEGGEERAGSGDETKEKKKHKKEEKKQTGAKSGYTTDDFIAPDTDDSSFALDTCFRDREEIDESSDDPDDDYEDDPDEDDPDAPVHRISLMDDDDGDVEDSAAATRFAAMGIASEAMVRKWERVRYEALGRAAGERYPEAERLLAWLASNDCSAAQPPMPYGVTGIDVHERAPRTMTAAAGGYAFVAEGELGLMCEPGTDPAHSRCNVVFGAIAPYAPAFSCSNVPAAAAAYPERRIAKNYVSPPMCRIDATGCIAVMRRLRAELTAAGFKLLNPAASASMCICVETPYRAPAAAPDIAAALLDEPIA
jgi:hypothetical protein